MESSKSELSFKEERSIRNKTSKSTTSRGTLSSDSFLLCAKSDESVPHHRVDVYSGPPTLPFPSLPPPDIHSKTFYTPSESPEPIKEIEPPLLPPKISRSQPVTVFPLHLQPEDDSREHELIHSSKIRAAMGNEEIVMSSAAVVSANTDQPRRREHKENNGIQQPPARPPKPKQYKIKPSSDIPIINDRTLEKERKSERRETATEPRRRIHSRSRREESPKKRAERSKTLPKPREQDNRRNNSPSKSRPRRHSAQQTEKDINDNEKKLKQLQRQEELLRQIIQGITEAEMLQSKVERTKRWSNEQKMQTLKARKETNKAKRRNTTAHEKNGKRQEKRRHESRRKDSRPRHRSVATPD